MDEPLVVEIRPADDADARHLAQLCTELGYRVEPCAAAARLAGLTCRADHIVWTAVDPQAGQIVGWIHVYLTWLLISDVYAEVGGLVVASGYRRRKVGEKLLAQAEAWAAAHDCRQLRVRSNVVRQAAHRFYLGNGYRLEKDQHVFTKSL
jgi:(aminoalkyl)phosphonate N-acetyltransferase